MNIDEKNYEVDPSGVPYVDIANLINVFSNTEYDSLEKAASEIIDNAIDANSNNIIIFLNTQFNALKGKNVLSEIAFLDDGEGMSQGVLQHMVGFGNTIGTGENSIGKFGIGLNQASLYACNKFSVYSWQNENEVYLEIFDADYIRKNNIARAEPPRKVELPEYIKKSRIFQSYCKKHGTLVVWENLKPNMIHKPSTIASHMKKEFGRVYRYYLNSPEFNIYIEPEFGNAEAICAIDPMFLLNNTDFLGDIEGHSNPSPNGEPIFELFKHELLVNGKKRYSIPYYDSNHNILYSYVTLTASIVKEKFYYDAAIKDNIKQPGDTPIGKYVKEFQRGITIVRNKREIDFKYFGFYDSTNQPQDRWFKIEIQFYDELDEAFHVSNNKQHVELKKITQAQFVDSKPNDPDYPLWLRLHSDIETLLGAMRKRNKIIASQSKLRLHEKNLNEYEEITSIKQIKSLTNVIEDNLKPKDIKVNTSKEDADILSLHSTDSSDFSSGILNDSNVLYEEKNDLSNDSFYEKSGIIVTYGSEYKNWVTYEYDFSVHKYMIEFNLDKINKSRFNKSVEFLVVSLCVAICAERFTKNVYDKLVGLLNKYAEYLCLEG